MSPLFEPPKFDLEPTELRAVFVARLCRGLRSTIFDKLGRPIKERRFPPQNSPDNSENVLSALAFRHHPLRIQSRTQHPTLPHHDRPPVEGRFLPMPRSNVGVSSHLAPYGEVWMMLLPAPFAIGQLQTTYSSRRLVEPSERTEYGICANESRAIDGIHHKMVIEFNRSRPSHLLLPALRFGFHRRQLSRSVRGFHQHTIFGRESVAYRHLARCRHDQNTTILVWFLAVLTDLAYLFRCRGFQPTRHERGEMPLKNPQGCRT